MVDILPTTHHKIHGLGKLHKFSDETSQIYHCYSLEVCSTANLKLLSFSIAQTLFTNGISTNTVQQKKASKLQYSKNIFFNVDVLFRPIPVRSYQRQPIKVDCSS